MVRETVQHQEKGIMKTGKTLVELAQELQKIQADKEDFIVPTSKLSMNEAGVLEFTNGKTHTFQPTTWAQSQVASYTNIPKAYFDRIAQENPKLLSDSVNHGLTQAVKENPGDARLIRTINGKARGFLSSRYRVLDAHDLLEATLPALLRNEFQVESSEVTERRLYLKTSTPRIQGEVKKGDVVQYGVMISTSDVGAGSLRIEPFITRLACLNGMVMDTQFKKAHLGRNNFEGDIQLLLSDDTKRLNDAAFFATVKDYLDSTMRPEVFEAQINKMREAANQPIKNFDLDEVVQLSMKSVGVNGENIKKGILHALASGNEGAGLTKWGLANSFTRAAQMDDLDYDTATDLERAGGLILELNKTQWSKIAEAA
jgi:hypothetical protein